MIIVKTKNGDKFVNDKNIICLEHDHKRETVTYWATDSKHGSGFAEVEGVIYTNDAQPTSWKDEGSDIKRLEERLEDRRRDSDWLSEYVGELKRHLRELANEIIGISFCNGDIPRSRFDHLHEMADKIVESIEDGGFARQQWEKVHSETIEHEQKEEERIKGIIKELREELIKLREYNFERREEIYRLMHRNLWQRISNKPA